MTDNEIAGELRKWADVLQYNHRGFNPQWQSMYNAADLIESLQAQLTASQRMAQDARNELCQRCGRYKEAHKGACDGCRWKED